jgi:signal transduction histidine kinase
MSSTSVTTAMPATRRAAQLRDPQWQATAVAGAALLLGLAVALTGSAHVVAAVGVTLAGVVVGVFVLAPRAAGAVHRHPALLAVALLGLLGLLWAGLGLTGFDASLAGLLPGSTYLAWLWSLGDAALLPLMAMTLAATGGVVLIADALRARLGLTGRPPAAPWQQMTAAADDGARDHRAVPWRAVAGVLLIAWAAFLGVGIAGPYVAGTGLLQILVLVLVMGAAAVVIGTPLLIASLTRADRDQAGSAWEDERQRFAAHLHDSVLQTLALVQRQAHDPAAVARLARRQEHALRAWMAGEADLLSETLGAALRDVVAEVEDEQRITIELSIIGDRPIDPAGEALAAAAREALRNAARHAAGAAVFVFAEIGPRGVEVFVRDEGPGFVFADVPSERRGLRDAVIGRMAAVGGSAAIESAPDEGTEVALRLRRTGAGR